MRRHQRVTESHQRAAESVTDQWRGTKRQQENGKRQWGGIKERLRRIKRKGVVINVGDEDALKCDREKLNVLQMR